MLTNAVNSRSHQMLNIIHKYWSAKGHLDVNSWLLVGKRKGLIGAVIMDGQVLRISKSGVGGLWLTLYMGGTALEYTAIVIVTCTTSAIDFISLISVYKNNIK